MGKKEPKVQPEAVEETVQDAVTEERSAEEDQRQAELETLKTENKNYQDQYLRTLADMDNLRKRTQREKEELSKFANEGILREILPVIDNLERAVEHAAQTDSSEGLVEGVQMTLTQFGQVLNRFGVTPVESLGLLFDPSLHQAMGQIETDEYPANTVAQQMQKGYQLNQRLLRPAMVMVAKAPQSQSVEPVADEAADTDDK